MNIIGALIAIIITLIIVGVIWWAIQQLLPLIPDGGSILLTSSALKPIVFS